MTICFATGGPQPCHDGPINRKSAFRLDIRCNDRRGAGPPDWRPVSRLATIQCAPCAAVSITRQPRTARVSKLLVVARSESFAQLWPQLATAAGAAARVVAEAAEAAGAADALALLLSVAGVEEEG